jgi:hypothetical protein
MAAIDFPASPTAGDTFVAGNGVTYQWTGTIWIPIGSTQGLFVGDTPPASPGLNQLWWNSTSGQMYLWYNDGNTTQWVPAMPTLPVGVPAPLTWRQIGRIVPTAAQPTADFPNVPADINDLEFTFDVTPVTNGQGFSLQFFDGSGTIVNTGYTFSAAMTYNSIGVGAAAQGAGSTSTGFVSGIILHWANATRYVSNAVPSGGIRGKGSIPNIRNTAREKSCDFQSNHLADAGDIILSSSGSGQRNNVAGAITGLRFFFAGGFIAGGAITVWGSP